MTTPPGTSKRVARLLIEAPVASFRYPHFLIGRQPTFDMPPPSTVFGLIASALGELPTHPVQFAYSFQWRSRAGDLEHQHIISRTSGKLPGNIVDPLWRPPVAIPGKRKPTKKEMEPRLLEKTTEATVQPHTRDFLFDCSLELYLDPADLADSFRSPVFCLSLGRSQDLAAVRRIDIVELYPTDSGFLERTLLPGDLRSRLPWGVTTLMPRFIGPSPDRQPVFASYIVLHDRVYVGAAIRSRAKSLLEIAGEASPTWYADPAQTDRDGAQRLLYFHTLNPAEFADVTEG